MRKRDIVLRTVFWILLGVLLFYVLFPFYWTLHTSLLPEDRLGATPPDYLPIPADSTSYKTVLSDNRFVKAFLNSVIVASASTFLALALGSLSACAIGRYRFPFRRTILYLVLAMTMFPQVAIIGSLYTLMTGLRLYNTVYALILSNLILTLPFTVWVLSTFFKALPAELEESAYVDGASPFQAYWMILLPLCAPGLVTTGILAFIMTWNEYLFALVLTLNENARTLPVYIGNYTGETHHTIPWGQIMAASLLATGPLILLVFIFQKRLISGLTSGAVKG